MPLPKWQYWPSCGHEFGVNTHGNVCHFLLCLLVKTGQGPAWVLGRAHSLCLDLMCYTLLVHMMSPVELLALKMAVLGTEAGLGAVKWPGTQRDMGTCEGQWHGRDALP